MGIVIILAVFAVLIYLWSHPQWFMPKRPRPYDWSRDGLR